MARQGRRGRSRITRGREIPPPPFGVLLLRGEKWPTVSSPRRGSGPKGLVVAATARITTVVPLAYFVAIFDQGPAWKDSVPMREQEDWAGHAVFMNALTDDGFVVLGGPIGGGTRHRARLIVRSESEQDLRDRMAGDPWAQLGLLTLESVEEWEVLLSSESDS